MKVPHHRLGDLCTLTRGTSPTLRTEPGPYPLVVTAAFRRTADQYQLEGPTVCIPLISSTGHGDAALHRVHYQDGKFALANLLVALQPKDAKQCDAKYLYYLLTAKKDELFVPLMLGTANVSLKERDIAGVEIPLPSFAEQRWIVERVEAVVSRIAEAKRLREEATAEQSRFVTSLHCKLAGDRILAIGDVLELHEIKADVKTDGFYPQVGVRGFGEGLFSKEKLSGSDTTYKAFNTLFAGAVVLSQVKGWEGAIAVCASNLAGWFVSPEYRTFRCRENEAEPGYLSELVKTPWFWERLAEPTRGVGARRERVRPELFLALRIPMPTVEQQRLALGMFGKLHALRAWQSETATELNALLPSVLNRAFAGKL